MMKPIICVPVIEKTGDRIKEKVRQLVRHQVPMIEWRMDWYEEASNPGQIKKMLQEIEDIFSGTALLKQTELLVTYRSNAQGGEGMLSHGETLSLLKLVAKSKAVGLVDLEFFELPEPERLIRMIQGCGKKVVASHHDFLKTPSVDTMKMQLLTMHQAGADYSKLAVMPRAKTDVLRLMEAVLLAKEEAADSHIVAMSMGRDGAITRVLGEWFGSELAFATFGEASAPGQISYEAERKLLEQVHEIM